MMPTGAPRIEARERREFQRIRWNFPGGRALRAGRTSEAAEIQLGVIGKVDDAIFLVAFEDLG